MSSRSLRWSFCIVFFRKNFGTMMWWLYKSNWLLFDLLTDWISCSYAARRSSVAGKECMTALSTKASTSSWSPLCEGVFLERDEQCSCTLLVEAWSVVLEVVSCPTVLSSEVKQEVCDQIQFLTYTLRNGHNIDWAGVKVIDHQPYLHAPKMLPGGVAH